MGIRIIFGYMLKQLFSQEGAFMKNNFTFKIIEVILALPVTVYYISLTGGLTSSAALLISLKTSWVLPHPVLQDRRKALVDEDQSL